MPSDSPAASVLAWVDRYRWWLFGLVLVLLAAGYNGQWRISPDSALYAELGRNIADGRGFTYHGEPHTWVEPGLPYTIGYSFRHFGTDNFHPLLLGMLACAIAALGLTYVLFTLHAGRPTAVLVTALLGLNDRFYRYVYYLFTDMPFLVAVLTFLVGYELIVRNPRRRSLIAWPLVAGATLFMVAFRPAVITFVGAVAVTCAWHVLRGPWRVRHVILGIVVLASFLSFRLVDPRRAAAPGGETHRESMLKNLLGERLGFAMKRMATQWVPMLFEETTTKAVFGVEFGPGVSSVATIGVFTAGVLLVRRRVLWGAWVAATLAQMALWLPRERYFVPILPLLLFGVWTGGLWLARTLPFGWRRWVPIALLVLLVTPNLLFLSKYIYEQRRTSFLQHYERGEKLAVMALAQEIQAAVPADATVFADAGRELSYFSRRKVEDPITHRRIPPTDAEYEQLREKLADDPLVFVALPGKKTQALIDRLDGQLGEVVVSGDTYTVYRVRFTVPRGTTQP